MKPDDTFEVRYPFIRDTYTEYDVDGPCERKTWRPGVRFEQHAPDDADAVADGVGAQIVTVVDVHKPGRFQTRVFYTRQWRSPDGRLFGKGGLKVKTLQAFRRLIAGYRYPYAMAGQPRPEPEPFEFEEIAA